MARQRRNQQEMQDAPQLRRNSVDAQAQRAEALARNPEFRALFDSQRTEIVSSLEGLVLDGSRKAEETALELVRQLQTLVGMRRTLLWPVARAKMAEKQSNRDPDTKI